MRTQHVVPGLWLPQAHGAIRGRRPAILLLALGLAGLAGCQDETILPTGVPPVSDVTLTATGPVVNSTADPGDGTCAEGECTLREAIAAAEAGETITFDVTGEINLFDQELASNGELAINQNLTIEGPGAGQLAVGANLLSRVFSIGSGRSVTISGLSIRAGHDDLGGGIHNEGSLTLDGVIVELSSAGSGGAIYNASDATLTVTGSSISGNSGVFGGGIYNEGVLAVTKSTISGNTGGGIHQRSLHAASVANSTFSGGNDDGIIISRGVVAVTNTTFAGNGTGIDADNSDASVTVTHSTFSGNTIGVLLGSHGVVTLKNTILANNGTNCDPGLEGSLNDGGYNLEGGDGTTAPTTCGFSGTSQSVPDAMLGPLADNGGPTKTFALLEDEGGPAIDAIPNGTNGCGTAVTEDQRGVDRPQPAGGDCDIGAFEVEAAADVDDEVPPELTLPADITADATGPDGAIVGYAATATDDVDGAVTPSCSPASGSTFAIGATSVECSATDQAGNTADGSFTVTVVGAAAQVDDLEQTIQDMSLDNGAEKSLLTKLGSVEKSLAKDNTDAACSQLADFLAQLPDMEDAGKLTADQAAELTDRALRIQAVLGC